MHKVFSNNCYLPFAIGLRSSLVAKKRTLAVGNSVGFLIFVKTLIYKNWGL